MSTHQPTTVFKGTFKILKVFSAVLLLLGLAMMGGFLAFRDTFFLVLGGITLTVGVGMSILFWVREPPELSIDGDTVVYLGHRYPLLLVEIGQKERRSNGNTSYLMFELSGVDEQDKYRELEIVATVWPQFDVMHKVLSEAVMQAKRKQIADEARRMAEASPKRP